MMSFGTGDEWLKEYGKRLGIQHADWCGDWFVSHSPRNGNECAEGPWGHWVEMALGILQNPATALIRPEAHEAVKEIKPKDYYDDCDRYLTEAELNELFATPQPTREED